MQSSICLFFISYVCPPYLKVNSTGFSLSSNRYAFLTLALSIISISSLDKFRVVISGSKSSFISCVKAKVASSSLLRIPSILLQMNAVADFVKHFPSLALSPILRSFKRLFMKVYVLSSLAYMCRNFFQHFSFRAYSSAVSALIQHARVLKVVCFLTWSKYLTKNSLQA